MRGAQETCTCVFARFVSTQRRVST